MDIINTEISGVKILVPKVFHDKRGFFLESFNSNIFNTLVCNTYSFVQDNHSHSKNNVLRGLHYQTTNPQAKLVRVLNGEIYDVAVDLRKSSKTFGKWVGKKLSSENNHQIWIPDGFAHGFYVISDSADVLYKTTDFYEPKSEKCILWNDPSLSISWPTDKNNQPIISLKDQKGTSFLNADYFE